MNTGVSLTFKNQWGCIPEPKDRLRLHPEFARVVFEVNRAIHAGIAIVDGRMGAERQRTDARASRSTSSWLLVTDDLGAGARLCCELMQIPLDAGRAPPLRGAARGGARSRRDRAQPGARAVPAGAVLSAAPVDRLPGPVRLPQPAAGLPGLLLAAGRASLHALLYLFREPFYDYGSTSPRPPECGHRVHLGTSTWFAAEGLSLRLKSVGDRTRQLRRPRPQTAAVASLGGTAG